MAWLFSPLPALLILAVSATAGAQPRPASLDVSPVRLSFIADDRAERLPSQRVEIRNGGDGDLVWRARADAPWVVLNPQRGLAPATLLVTIDAKDLKPGTYSSRVTIEAPQAAGSPQTVAVRVAITGTQPPGPPSLQVSPDHVTFSAPPGQTQGLAFSLRIEAEQNAAVRWTARSDDAWLKVSPAEGTTPADLSLTASPGALSIGEHTAQVVVRSGGRGAIIRVPVVLSIEAAGGRLSFDATTLPAAALNLPYSHALPLRGGHPPYTFQLAGSLPPELALVNGVVTGTPKTPGTFAVALIARDSSDPPMTVTATLTLPVVVVDQRTVLAATPDRVRLTATPDAAPQPITVSVTSGGPPLAWRVSANASWVRLDPGSGSAPGSFTVGADTAGMKQGTYTASVALTMQGAANSPMQIPVELTIKR